MAEQQEDMQLIEARQKGRQSLTEELSKVIVGQKDVVDLILTALFCEGHSLIIGVPGLAKTLIVKSIAEILDLKFSRIQFTPDLMPSDIIGTDIIEEDAASGRRSFTFIKGPVFANIILADEINRTPPKTQSALLEAMQEYEVTTGGTTYALEKPFFVLATQNPIEQEGTYPLPEAQLDRFMFAISIDYPSNAEEVEIVRETTSLREISLGTVMCAADILDLQRVIRKIPVSEEVLQYAVNLAASTRPGGELAPDFVNKFIRWGAGPRASQYLVLGAKARSVIRGNLHVSFDDVKFVAPSILGHRIIRNFYAESEGAETPDLIRRLLETVQP